MLTFSDINLEEAQQKKPISSLICCPLLSLVSHMTQVHLLLYPKASVYYYFYYNYYHLIYYQSTSDDLSPKIWPKFEKTSVTIAANT